MNLRLLARRFGAAALVFLVAVVAVLVYAQLTYSSSYLLLPDTPHALAPLVKVKAARKSDSGSLYFVDVIERRATLAERYLPFLRRDGTLLPQQDIGPSSVDAASMTLSQKVAKVVALRALGYKIAVRTRVVVQSTKAGTSAAKQLRPGDVITALDGKPVSSYAQLHDLVSRHRPGERVRVTFTRKGIEHTVTVRTFALPGDPSSTLIGVTISEPLSVKLPIKVTIDTGNVGGPSAGLAFALELTDKLGRDIDRGFRVAATGELSLDGAVHAIGGVKQKVIGARRAGIQIMLVPVDGDNAKEARRYAGTMKIIPVTSFQQALHALATVDQAR